MNELADNTLFDDVLRLEASMQGMPKQEIKVKHYFSKGVYAREIFIPKGTTLVGHIHKYENLNIVSQGDLSVTTEEGVKRVTAPCTIVSPRGTKRAAYAHEDTIWTTIHGTDETDIDKIESFFVAKSTDEYLAFSEKLKIEGE